MSLTTYPFTPSDCYLDASDIDSSMQSVMKISNNRYDRLMALGFSEAAIVATEYLFELYRMYGMENVILHGADPVSHQLIYDVKF